MTEYLNLESLLQIAAESIGSQQLLVRDYGLLESALARPATEVFGVEAYPTLPEKAAALLHSITAHHALVDGNKRLGLAATAVFIHINGCRLTASNDEAYDLVMDVASGNLPDVQDIASRLRPWVRADQSATPPATGGPRHGTPPHP